MQLDRFTEKAQEAIVAAQRLAETLQSPTLDAEHLLAALIEPDDGIPAETLRRIGVDLPAFRSELAGILSRRARIQGGSLTLGPRAQARRRAGRRRRPAGWATTTSSTEHLLLATAEAGGEAQALLGRHRADREALLGALQNVRGGQRVTNAEPREHLPGAREVRPRPHRRGAGRQARPGHRPGRGDPAGHPGPQPADEEQPGAHRRAGRRQDRHRRGPRAAHRAGRRPRGPQGQARRQPRPGRAHRRGEVPGRVRGAPQGRPQGDQGLRTGRSSCSSTSSTRSWAPAPPRARWTRRTS